jgi:hypothetical protein
MWWIWKEAEYYPGVFLEWLKNTTKNLGQDIRSPG